MESLARNLEVVPDRRKSVKPLQEELLKRKAYIRKNRIILWSLITALGAWSWIGTNFSILHLYAGLTNMASFIFTDMLPPDFTVIGQYINPALQTIYMSFAGMVMSVFLSIFFGILSAKNTTFHPIVAFSSRAVVAFLRAIPALIWGILLVVAFGLGSFAGTLALGLSGIGILGKAYADVLEEIDERQVEAVRATGASWLQIMGQAVWPQFKTGFVAWSLYKMDLNIREAAVLGLIGAGGVGYVLQGNINLFQYQQAAVGILMIFLLILIVEFSTAKIRERLL